MLLYPLRLHGGQRHSPVGTAHTELQLRRGQLRARMAGGASGAAYGSVVRRHRDAGIHGRASGARRPLPRRGRRGRCGGAHSGRRTALLRLGIHILRGQYRRHRI